ncbi:hypothetical protein A8709_33085 [Paenibacillus pectinilyticus]|uniref:Uncharacterized protein n=1 Tax=Paenibacillus pectinilyticus TaxID=512399 RepID=A0A1C0ZX32_9BACL|nr:hypothetical protein [Paenibacillus pectinilyticus]OCT12647.1 hypothetical protein A8709_33085 [Paenibacillus pectinilyticus]
MDYESMLTNDEKQIFIKLVSNMPEGKRLTINQTIDRLIELPLGFLRKPMSQMVNELIQSS